MTSYGSFLAIHSHRPGSRRHLAIFTMPLYGGAHALGAASFMGRQPRRKSGRRYSVAEWRRSHIGALKAHRGVWGEMHEVRHNRAGKQGEARR